MTGARRSIRLEHFDYASPGAYFVTVCTQERRPLLRNAAAAASVRAAWDGLRQRFRDIELDAFVIMPDHVHFVVHILEPLPAGGRAAEGAQLRAPTLAAIVGSFKTVVTKAINAHRGRVGTRVWQRNYYEHIVRDGEGLDRIRDYIEGNPLTAHGHESGDLSGAWKPPPPPGPPP